MDLENALHDLELFGKLCETQRGTIEKQKGIIITLERTREILENTIKNQKETIAELEKTCRFLARTSVR